MIQVTRHGMEVFSSAEVLENLRGQFARNHYCLLPGLLEAQLLDLIQQQIERGEFRERIHEGIDSNKELCLTANPGLGGLLFLMNDEKLFKFIQDITRCDRIGCFEGRVYRVNPGPEHHDSWHNDVGDERLVGMSINLSRETYSGGTLQIRDHDSHEILSEAPNTGLGDAIVFRLSAGLQHRVTEVNGETPKTAFAGWFRAQPHFSSLLKFYRRPVNGNIHQMTFPLRARASGPIDRKVDY